MGRKKEGNGEGIGFPGWKDGREGGREGGRAEEV